MIVLFFILLATLAGIAALICATKLIVTLPLPFAEVIHIIGTVLEYLWNNPLLGMPVFLALAFGLIKLGETIEDKWDKWE